MITVSHSKCSKCGKVQRVAQLKENPDAVGSICKDEVECKGRIAEDSKATGIKDPK
jgi:hypothetical protein